MVKADKIPQRVEIQWDDAVMVEGAWHRLVDAISKEGRALLRIRSIGYVIYEDDKVLILAGGFHDDRVGRVGIIPRRSIVSVRRLR